MRYIHTIYNFSLSLCGICISLSTFCIHTQNSVLFYHLLTLLHQCHRDKLGHLLHLTNNITLLLTLSDYPMLWAFGGEGCFISEVLWHKAFYWEQTVQDNTIRRNTKWKPHEKSVWACVCVCVRGSVEELLQRTSWKPDGCLSWLLLHDISEANIVLSTAPHLSDS